MIKAFLQGKPFGYPLHPAVIHFPIGLFFLTVLLDVANLLIDTGNVLAQSAFYTVSFGLIAALIAILLGLVDWSDIRADHPAKYTATIHMILNLTATALFGISWWLRSVELGKPTATAPLLAVLLAIAGMGIIFYSGYLGGSMVYDDGLAVGRHRRRTDTPDHTIHASSKDSPDGFARIAPVDALRSEETLHAEVDGHVMTIAKLNGELYAFQEFCTHRFGPLSEGQFQDHNIMCPWHGSCFDVRTGKVTQGPAKVDLKTYEVKLESGQIFVRVITK